MDVVRASRIVAEVQPSRGLLPTPRARKVEVKKTRQNLRAERSRSQGQLQTSYRRAPGKIGAETTRQSKETVDEHREAVQPEPAARSPLCQPGRQRRLP